MTRAEMIATLRKPAAAWPLQDTGWMIDAVRALLAERDALAERLTRLDIPVDNNRPTR